MEKEVKKILIVDDEKNLTMTLVDYLSSKYNCHGVYSVEEAIEYLEKNEVDLVLSDMKLPGKDGFELLTWLNENMKDVRFVLMTAYGSPSLKKRVKDHGALFYLEKPIDLSQLNRIIDRVVKETGIEASVRELELEDLLKILSFYEKDLVLRVINKNGERGYIGIKTDKVMWAKTEKKSGLSAFRDMLGWNGGIFSSNDYYELQSGRIEKRIDTLLKECSGLVATHNENEDVFDIEIDIVEDKGMNPEIDEGEDGKVVEVKSVSENEGLQGFENVLNVERAGGTEEKKVKTKGEKEEGIFLSVSKIQNDSLESIKEKGGNVMVTRGASSLEGLLEKFKSEIRGFVLTALADFENGLALASVSETDDFDAETASAVYAEVIKQSHQAANFMGGEEHLGDLEDILITHENVYILLKMVGEKHFQILALSTDKGNLGLAKIVMRNYEPFFLETLKEIGEL